MSTYKLKTHFNNIPKGIKVDADDKVHGDNIIYRISEDKWIGNPQFLEQNPDWFEKVEKDFEVGDWVFLVEPYSWGAKSGDVAKLDEIERSDDISYAYRTNGSSKYWAKKVRKASKDEIKEHLVKEAEKRGFGKYGNKFKSTISDSGLIRTIHPYYESDDEVIWRYKKNDDALRYGNGIGSPEGGCSNPAVYRQGEWAEIVDTGINVKINDYDVELINGENRLFSIGFKNVGGSVFEDLSHYAAEYGLNIRRNGENITSQIHELADYVKNN